MYLTLLKAYYIPVSPLSKYETVIEEYLEIVAGLLTDNPVARIKDIACARGVTLPTASSAVEKLRQLGLVHHRAYSYVTLTEEGQKLAERLETSHQALKELLVKVLNVPESIAEEDACKMEHQISPQTLNAMENLTRFLAKCPRAETEWLKIYRQCRLVASESSDCGDCEFRREGDESGG